MVKSNDMFRFGSYTCVVCLTVFVGAPLQLCNSRDGMLRGRIVQTNDKSIKIANQGNFGTLISKRSDLNLQSKVTVIENVNFSNDFK